MADCNNASGGYTTDGSSLTIEIGPMTKAACPPESRSDQFVQLLSGAAVYFFEDGNLFIDLMVDGGTMACHPVSDTLRARTLQTAAMLAYRQGNWEAAQPELEESLGLSGRRRTGRA